MEAVLEAIGKKLRVGEDGSVIGGYEKKVKRKWKKNPVKWWDKECEEIVEQRKTDLHNYMKDKTRKNWIEYKRSRAVARKTIKKKKREDFSGIRRVSTEIVILSMYGVEWKFLKIETTHKHGISGKEKTGYSYKRANWKNRTPEEDNYEKEIIEVGEKIRGTRMERMNRKFSMAELDRAIESARVKPSPGVVGIEYRMIKRLCEGVKEIFLSLINEAFERGAIFLETERSIKRSL